MISLDSSYLSNMFEWWYDSWNSFDTRYLPWAVFFAPYPGHRAATRPGGVVGRSLLHHHVTNKDSPPEKMEKWLDITRKQRKNMEKHHQTTCRDFHWISRSYHPYLWWTLNSHASIDRYWSHQLLKWPASSNTMRLKILCTRSCPWHLRHQQGPKRQMSLLFMFFSMGTWEHTKCGWAYFGHLHTICTPCATKSESCFQFVKGTWEIEPSTPEKLCQVVPNHAKSLQKTGSPSLAPSVLAPRLSNLQVLALLWLAQPPRL